MVSYFQENSKEESAMKTCPNCRNQIADEAVYCPICGNGIGTAPNFTVQPTPPPPTDYSTAYQPQPVPVPVPYVDPFDHTDKFDAADISENKVLAMLCYLLGPLGILMAQLAAGKSKYAAFHIRQAMLLTVTEILGLLALAVGAFLLWELRLRVFMLFVVAIALIGLAALHLICFFQVCKGKAKEVYIVRNLKFLK